MRPGGCCLFGGGAAAAANFKIALAKAAEHTLSGSQVVEVPPLRRKRRQLGAGAVALQCNCRLVHAGASLADFHAVVELLLTGVVKAAAARLSSWMGVGIWYKSYWLTRM